MTATTLPRRALVGYDAQPRSDAPVLAALELNRRFGTEIELLHVVDVPEPQRQSGRRRPAADLRTELMAAAQGRGKRHLEDLLSRHGEGALHTRDLHKVVCGHPARALVERARETDADLIVLGPHDRHGRIDFGGTARGVLHTSSSNVWMQPCAPRAIEHVLVPLDLSADSLAALDLGLRLAEGFGARLTALHCYEPPTFAYSLEAIEAGAATSEYVIEEDREHDREEFERELEGFDWRGVEHDVRLVEGLPAEVILNQEDVDLISLGTHGHTGLAAAVLGGVTYEVLRRARIPVLAVRLPNRSWLLGG